MFIKGGQDRSSRAWPFITLLVISSVAQMFYLHFIFILIRCSSNVHFTLYYHSLLFFGTAILLIS
jgi:hypothetical protein